MRKFAILLLILTVLAAPSAARKAPYAGAILMEADTGQVLFEDRAERRWIPASMVKMMLMLLADEAIERDQVRLGDVVVASREARRMGGSQVYLGEGDEASFLRLLEAVAVGSANDAAMAVAEHLYGSKAAAVSAMNARATELGMESTVYVNVTGLPEGRRSPENWTCARDQALLARYIVNHNPRILEWTGKTWTRFRQGLVLGTTNTLMKEYEGMDGLKTGFHQRALSNLAATAVRDGRRLIAVVLGSSSPKQRNRSVERLLDSGFNDWQMHTAIDEGESLGAEFPVVESWNASVGVAAGAPLRFLVKPGDEDRVRIMLSEGSRLIAPLKKGEVIGEIQVVLDGEVLASVPALAEKRVGRAWFRLPFFGTPGSPPSMAAGLGGKG